MVLTDACMLLPIISLGVFIEEVLFSSKELRAVGENCEISRMRAHYQKFVMPTYFVKIK